MDARAASIPILTFPEELPVSAVRDDIREAISAHQVVIVCGQTGSGKTTQLPKICLSLGRGIRGLIGHTQPRRLAARAVASRLAEELDCELGEQVGFQVRFTAETSPQTLVKVMTDGILLAEIGRDPLLRAYDTIIVDEAHERSLNIDFLLGYLAHLLPRRPDLKVIITSATIDAEHFAAHFRAASGAEVPVINVSGRTYPVEIRYRPLAPETQILAPEKLITSLDDTQPGAENKLIFEYDAELSNQGYGLGEPLDLVGGIVGAVDELLAEGSGDILVFLPGEQDIRDAAAGLAEHLGRRYLEPGGKPQGANPIEVVPLFARLTLAQQQLIFKPHPYQRIVLSTNVAETSLTVPGIRYVIDSGLARISRFSNRTKVQRLPIEDISQASANQRAGRCGRTAPGICIRLYSPANFVGRPAYTEPEILRTSLASVILQMTSLRLGAIADFPFLDPPDPRAVRDGVNLLVELGALHPPRPGKLPALTKIGRSLARLPIDPRLGRMLLEADRNGCASEVCVIVAALSMQDVRERPAEAQAAADAAHTRFLHPSSDFIAYLNIWRYLRKRSKELSSSAFRRMARAEFLHYLRIREWEDLVRQLRQLAKEVGINISRLDHNPNAKVDEAGIHRSILVGLLSNLGMWDPAKKDYAGARGSRFVIWPGSGLAKRSYDWVMASELVETSRLFARTVGRIDPAWAEAAGAHLLRRVYEEPYWSTRQGAAMVHEKVILYGLTLAANRPVRLANVADLGGQSGAELAREMFIRHALVAGEWHQNHAFMAENARLLEEAREVERRTRELGQVADEEVRFEFFNSRLPAGIVGAVEFDSWWKHARKDRPDLLTYPAELLSPASYSVRSYPDVWDQPGVNLPLSYTFAAADRPEATLAYATSSERPKKPGQKGKQGQKGRPGPVKVAEMDYAEGVTVTIPEAELGQVDPRGFDWGVPGMARERCLAVIRALPKRVRRNLVPAPDLAEEITADLAPYWQTTPALRPPFAEAFKQAVRQRRGVDIDAEAWEEMLTRLPDHLRTHFVISGKKGAFVAGGDDLLALQRELAEENTSPVELPPDPTLVAREALAKRRGEVLELLRLAEKRIVTRWTGAEAATLATSPYPSTAELVEDAQRAAVAELLDALDADPLDTTPEALAQALRDRYEDAVYAVMRDAVAALGAAKELAGAAKKLNSLVLLKPLTEVKAQRNELLQPGFLSATPAPWRGHLARYLQGYAIRLDKASRNLPGDETLAWQVAQAQALYDQAREAFAENPYRQVDPETGFPLYDAEREETLVTARWWLEELRVSLFAQQLGTSVKISLNRFEKLLNP